MSIFYSGISSPLINYYFLVLNKFLFWRCLRHFFLFWMKPEIKLYDGNDFHVCAVSVVSCFIFYRNFVKIRSVLYNFFIKNIFLRKFYFSFSFWIIIKFCVFFINKVKLFQYPFKHTRIHCFICFCNHVYNILKVKALN